MKLSICIPTYNRLDSLQTCIGYLLPQVAELPPAMAEIVIVDNASTDATGNYIRTLAGEYPCVKAYTNERNVGIDGNTARCIELAQGEYTALLSDDDFYLDGQVAQILHVVSARDYCLLRLNFHSFLDDPAVPYQTFAAEQDVVFECASDMLTFFHGGHFSGVVYRSVLAKAALAQMKKLYTFENTGRAHGVFGEVEIRIITTSPLPARFIGKRLLATSIPKTIDYAGIRHIALEYIQVCERMYNDGVLPRAEFERRKHETIDRLPQMIVTFSPGMSRTEIIQVAEKLDGYLGEYDKFRYLVKPLFAVARFAPVRAGFRTAHRLLRKFKRTVLRRSGVLIVR